MKNSQTLLSPTGADLSWWENLGLWLFTPGIVFAGGLPVLGQWELAGLLWLAVVVFSWVLLRREKARHRWRVAQRAKVEAMMAADAEERRVRELERRR